MRRVIVGAMCSLDGVMQAPGGPQEDPTAGFKFGGWVAPLADDPVFGEEIGKLFGAPFDLLLLFDDASQPRTFKLTQSAVSPNGIVHATYARAGEVQTATVGGATEPTPAELARREKLKRER